jgi:hypothetical protein
LAPQEFREDGATRADGGSKIKKKLSEFDIRGKMDTFDIRPKGGKRTGIEDFYVHLDEPHRKWYPGEVIKGLCTLEMGLKED